MMHKICFFCGSKNLVKDGFSNGHKRVRYMACSKWFVDKKRLDKDLLYKEYVVDKQSISQIASHHHVSPRTIQRHLDNRSSTSVKKIAKRDVVLLMDATYRGRKFGVLAFKDAHTRQVLWRKFLS